MKTKFNIFLRYFCSLPILIPVQQLFEQWKFVESNNPLEEAKRLSDQMKKFLNKIESSNIDEGAKKIVRNTATKFLIETS